MCDYYKNIKEGEPGRYEEITEHKPNQFYEICSKVSRWWIIKATELSELDEIIRSWKESKSDE